MASKLPLFLAELKRRKVYHVGAAYVAVGTTVVIAAHFLLVEVIELSPLPVKVVLALVVLGFPIALVLAWAYEVRPEEPKEAEPTTKKVIDTPETEQRKSIVVLPFDNMSPDPGDAYFADGLTEEIIADLSCCGLLRVISRSSAMALKATQKDVRTIGKELDVQYVLEGSVRKAGEDVRITAQLIDAASDEHLWAEKFEGTLQDVFGIQEEVSRSIVGALEIKLRPEEDHRISENPISDPRAHDFYLKASYEFRLASEESLERALEYLEEGLEIVGDNALLYAGMAIVQFYFVDAWGRPIHPTLDRAEQLAWKSLKLDPQSSLSHHLLGRIERHRGTATAAVRHFEQARRLDPNDSETLLWLSWMYPLFLGKPEVGGAAADRLLEVDPLTPLGRIPSAWVDWMEGRYESALVRLDENLERFPEVRWPLFFKTQLLGRKGDLEESLRVADAVVAENPSDFVSALCSMYVSAVRGDHEAFLGQLTDSFKDTLWNDPECPFWMAGWSGLLSLKEEAMNWLERAVDRGWINFPLLAQDDPFLDNVRDEPRFVELMERIKPVWEGFEV